MKYFYYLEPPTGSGAVDYEARSLSQCCPYYIPKPTWVVAGDQQLDDTEDRSIGSKHFDYAKHG